jgi:3-isopropylmalate dehydrogenase
MCLRYSLNQPALADAIEEAVQIVLNKGIRTADITGKGSQQVSTSGMGDALIAELKAAQAKAA